MKRWEDFSEEEILQANVDKYAQEPIVDFYKNFKESRYSYIEYSVVFSAVLDMLRNEAGTPVTAVDMCGGAGKGAFVLKQCDPDCRVTLVDVAEKMLDIAARQAEEYGINDLNIVLSDAYSFFQQQGEYNIIVFSSAIHHFKDPVKLLQTAAQRLAPRGLIITIADPTLIIKTRRYRFFQFLASNPQYKLSLMKQYWNRLFSPNYRQAAAGYDFDVAEYQTYTGINDGDLSKRLEQVGLQTVLHMRYPAGEPYMTKIMPYLGMNWAFSLVLQKADNEYDYKALQWQVQEGIRRDMPYKVQFF